MISLQTISDVFELSGTNGAHHIRSHLSIVLYLLLHYSVLDRVSFLQGNMGLAPKVGATVITAPPMRTGGNIDDKRIGIGASMYYPVEVAGALLSMGDCHGAQGDGESSGTGIETSLNGKFK